jgi:hypothetical protein
MRRHQMQPATELSSPDGYVTPGDYLPESSSHFGRFPVDVASKPSVDLHWLTATVMHASRMLVEHRAPRLAFARRVPLHATVPGRPVSAMLGERDRFRS